MPRLRVEDGRVVKEIVDGAWSVESCFGCRVLATDGTIGRVVDLYFDDEKWVVRYLLVNTGDWLSGRRVLISPHAVRFIDVGTRIVVVAVTRSQVETSPDIDTTRPVSRLQEKALTCYYGHPEYWPCPTYWAWGAVPLPAPTREAGRRLVRERMLRQKSEASSESHLHSCRSIMGYHIEARDEPVGDVEDLLFDGQTWAILDVVVSTRGERMARRVRIAPEWIRRVSWDGRRLALNVGRESLRRHDPPGGRSASV